MHLHRSELRSPLSKVQGGYRSKARPFRLRSHWLWSLESVSLRPRFSPYDFGCVTTRRRFSQITRALLALKHWLLSSTTIEQGNHRGESRNLQQKQGGDICSRSDGVLHIPTARVCSLAPLTDRSRLPVCWVAPGFTGFSDRGYVHNSIYFFNIDRFPIAFFSASLAAGLI